MHPAPASPISPAKIDEDGWAWAEEGCGTEHGVPSSASRPSEHVMNADEIVAPEELQQQRDIRTPDMPTQAEMAELKDNGHTEYRDWCPDCIEGVGRE